LPTIVYYHNVPTSPAHGRRLIPQSLRRPAATVATSMAVLTTALGLMYHNDPCPGRIDLIVASAITGRLPPAQLTPYLLVRLGDPLSIAAFAALLATVALLLRRPRIAILAVCGPGAVVTAAEFLKTLVGRTYYGVLAFPSGHTAAITAVATVVALMGLGFAKCHLLVASALAAIGILITGALMALALLTRGLHYPTDTLGGFCTAIAMVLGIAFCIDAIPIRGSAHNHT
jgi:membrane-associated phospholipid phosphatase